MFIEWININFAQKNEIVHLYSLITTHKNKVGDDEQYYLKPPRMLHIIHLLSFLTILSLHQIIWTRVTFSILWWKCRPYTFKNIMACVFKRVGPFVLKIDLILYTFHNRVGWCVCVCVYIYIHIFGNQLIKFSMVCTKNEKSNLNGGCTKKLNFS